MRSNTRRKESDAIYDAVRDKLRSKGKGFFIISCGAWIHPENKVPNCYAIMLDGFIQYKFELTMDGYKAAEVRSTDWIWLPLTIDITYTQQELVKLIKESV